MRKNYDLGIFKFDDYAMEMISKELILVNGGSCSGGYRGSSCGGGYSGGYTGSYKGKSSPTYSSCGGSYTNASYTRTNSLSSYGNCGGSYRMTYISGVCGGSIQVQPLYTKQRTFSCGNGYTEKFGNNACAATSLLNEISEQYTKETGLTMTVNQRNAAMDAAVKSKNIDAYNAFVNDWAGAANDMAKVLGLNGKYSYTNDRNENDIKIYASDTDGDGYYNHFVNDIGNGEYYDPFTGTIGKVSSLTLATKGIGETRNLSYSN